MMRTQIFIAATLLGLGGCSSPVRPDSEFGSMLPAPSAAHDAQMADDAARQLASVYPPASTRFSMRHAAQDDFGRQLTARLRAKGYALQEMTTPASSPRDSSTASESGDTKSTPLGYVLDSVASPRLYRITLSIGSQTISRAYVEQNDLVHPAGAWVRKE